MWFRFFKFRSHNIIRTMSYVHRGYGILDRGLVPKPFGFRQRMVLRAEEARPGVATYVAAAS